MLKTNEKRLVRCSVAGEISNPAFSANPYRITAATGGAVILPGTGGITYNIRVGDSAVDWEADHVEPGVTIKNRDREESLASAANNGLNVLSCVGNEVTVMTGAAKGKKGVVTGKHGGVEHVIVDFDEKTMDKMMIGDKMLIRSFGQGLKLLDYPEISVMNTDPRLLAAMGIRERGGALEVPVTHTIPSAIMGSGLGVSQTYTGDYDIQLFDSEMVKKHSLFALRLGDIVAITDADHAFGRIYRKGTTVIGIVIHSNSVVAGHGPGVTTLMSSRRIRPVIDRKANIAGILKLRKGF